jgi:copper transport protein
MMVVIALMAIPAALWAHGALKSSSPSRNARLTALPAELRLTFTERVELSVARLVLIRGMRDTVSLAPLAIDTSGRTLVAALANDAVRGGNSVATAGEYVIHWLVTGQDGHPVRGTVPFTVIVDTTKLGDSAVQLPAKDSIVPRRDGGVGSETASSDTAFSGTVAGGIFASNGALHTAARWLAFSAFFALLGTIVSLIAIVPSLERQGRSGFAQAVRSRAIFVGLVSGVLLVVVESARLVLQHHALTVDGVTLSYASLLGTTTWGTAWLVRSQAVVAALLALMLASRVTRSWYRASVGIVAMSVLGISSGMSLGGHAAGVIPMLPAVVVDMAHLISAGAWIGTLGLLLVVVFPLLRSDAATALIAVRTFSGMAMLAVATMLITGVVSAVNHVGSWDALTQSAYGQALLIKLAVVVAVLALGARNQWRVRNDRKSAGERIATVRASGRVELITAVIVLLVTSVLVAMPTPPTALH